MQNKSGVKSRESEHRANCRLGTFLGIGKHTRTDIAINDNIVNIAVVSCCILQHLYTYYCWKGWTSLGPVFIDNLFQKTPLSK